MLSTGTCFVIQISLHPIIHTGSEVGGRMGPSQPLPCYFYTIIEKGGMILKPRLSNSICAANVCKKSTPLFFFIVRRSILKTRCWLLEGMYCTYLTEAKNLGSHFHLLIFTIVISLLRIDLSILTMAYLPFTENFTSLTLLNIIKKYSHIVSHKK